MYLCIYIYTNDYILYHYGSKYLLRKCLNLDPQDTIYIYTYINFYWYIYMYIYIYIGGTMMYVKKQYPSCIVLRSSSLGKAVLEAN